MQQSSHWAEVEQLYHRALELDPAARQTLLDAQDNPAIRADLESLLAQESDSEDFLEHPAWELASAQFSHTIEPGSMLGPYKILRQIGKGGMGSVFEAEQQQPVRRRVALKVITAGMDSEQLIRRFEAERQALALMDHPNIARVLDAGTSQTGRLYFVMELVDGMPIADYISSHHLALRDILSLFIPICRAIEHAHKKGIIHRDIKPSNILITSVDNQPTPKVIDFGIAKALSQPQGDHGTSTMVGTVMGTLDYMSPEQAGPDNRDIDTRSDVYSLGAVLYELITGKPPLDRSGLRTSSQIEVLQRILNDDPIPPSVRTTDAKLAKTLRGDLDWVVMRAIEKDRNRRYQSAAALAEDIELYLRDEPVVAAAPSRLYRFRRFAIRHRVALTTATVVLLTVIASTAFSIREAIRAREAEHQAAAVSEFLQNGLLAQVSPNVQASSNVRPDPDLKLRTALDRASQRISGRFATQPLIEAAIRHTIASTYLDLGIPKEAENHLLRARQLREANLGPNSEPALESSSLLSIALLREGKLAEAQSLAQSLLSARRSSLGDQHPATLTSLHNLAAIELALGKDVEAEKLWSQVVALRRKVLGDAHPNTLESMNEQAFVLGRLERYQPAIELLTRVVDQRSKLLGDEHPDTMGSRQALARAYSDGNDARSAVGLLRRVLPWQRRLLGPTHPDALRTQVVLGSTLASMGEFEESERLLEDCCRAAAAKTSIFHACQNNLANTLNAAGRYADAERLYRNLLQADLLRAGQDNPDSLRSMSNLAINLGLSKKYAESIALFQKVVALRQKTLGPSHPKTLASMDAQAQVFFRAGRLKEAEAAYREVVTLRRQVLGSDHLNTRYSELSLAQVRIAQKDFESARSLTSEPLPAQPSWMEAMRQSLLGASLAGQKQFAQAEPLLRASYASLKAQEKDLPLALRPELRDEVDRARQRLQLLAQR